MANYCKDFNTIFQYPQGLNDDQYNLLDKWCNYDFSYVNMNHPDEFQMFADELNNANMPAFELTFEAADENWMWTRIEHDGVKWVVQDGLSYKDKGS